MNIQSPNKLKGLIGNESGATAVEYAIMAALIAGAIFSTVQIFGTSVQAAFQSVLGGFEK